MLMGMRFHAQLKVCTRILLGAVQVVLHSVVGWPYPLVHSHVHFGECLLRRCVPPHHIQSREHLLICMHEITLRMSVACRKRMRTAGGAKSRDKDRQ